MQGSEGHRRCGKAHSGLRSTQTTRGERGAGKGLPQVESLGQSPSSWTAVAFLDNLKERLANRVQLTSDGHRVYVEAVEEVFAGDVDYAQLVKLYGQPEGETQTEKRYSSSECIGTKRKRGRAIPTCPR